MKRFFSKFLVTIRKKNIIPKFISLLLAVVLWGYLLSNSKGGELQFRIPIAVENLPGNMAVSSFSSRFVTVIVNGRADLLKNVNSSNIKAVLDLKNSKIGSAQYPIQIVRNEIPEGVDVSLRQKSVEVFVETRISKMLEVVPVITGSAANGFSIGPIRAKPDIVRVIGPGSVLDKLTKIDTPAISVAGAESDIIMNVNIKAGQSDLFDLDINTVQVVIPVAKEGAFLNFTVPIEIKIAAKYEKYEISLADTKTAVVHMRNNTTATVTDDINVGALIYLDSTNIEGLMKNKKKAVLGFPIGVAYNKNIYDLEFLFVSPQEAPVSISVKQ